MNRRGFFVSMFACIVAVVVPSKKDVPPVDYRLRSLRRTGRDVVIDNAVYRCATHGPRLKSNVVAQRIATEMASYDGCVLSPLFRVEWPKETT